MSMFMDSLYQIIPWSSRGPCATLARASRTSAVWTGLGRMRGCFDGQFVDVEITDAHGSVPGDELHRFGTVHVRLELLEGIVIPRLDLDVEDVPCAEVGVEEHDDATFTERSDPSHVGGEVLIRRLVQGVESHQPCGLCEIGAGLARAEDEHLVDLRGRGDRYRAGGTGT
jgi:hypothetical protein